MARGRDQGGIEAWATGRRLAPLLPRAAAPRGLHAALDADAPGRCWLVAVSGGADSTALAWWLWQHRPRDRSRMVLAHVAHGLRGEDSERDRAHVAALARRLGVGIEERDGRLPAGTRADESALRARRVAALRGLAEDLGGARVLLGHNADDLVEHVLLRLARGSGARGLAGLRPFGAGPGFEVARPLLGLGRGAIRDALAAAGVPWREDATNAAPVATRNRLRLDVVPALRAALPQDLAAAFLRARERLDEEDAALEAWLATFPAGDTDASRLDLRPLAGAPRALARRRLLGWLGDRGSASGLVDRLVEAVAEGRPLVADLGPSARLRVLPGPWVVVEPRDLPVALSAPCGPSSSRPAGSPRAPGRRRS